LGDCWEPLALRNGAPSSSKDGELSYQQQAEPVAALAPAVATKASVHAAYGKLPLHFEANLGQSDEQVKFLSRGRGYTLFLTSLRMHDRACHPQWGG
jgi:hypothetical protein